MTSRGKFITLEGIEGVGKSTHCAFLRDRLLESGLTVVTTREPGGTRLGEAVRGILLDPSLPAMTPLTELLLMFAARAEHLATVIEPALTRGVWVLCDRFTDATYAYQGGGRALDMAAIAQLEGLVQQGLRPDYTLLFDAPVPIALARAKSRSASDRFEAEVSEFFVKVQAVYRERAAREPLRFVSIDAAQTLPEVEDALRGWVRKLAL